MPQNNAPLIFTLRDQSFPGTLSGGEGHCFKSVRVEDGTLTEVTDLFLEMLQGGGGATQQQHCPSGVQHEYVTSREQWVRLQMDLLRKKLVGNWGNVKVCPLIPI